MFSTQTQSLCFLPNSIFNHSEAFNKRVWRIEILTKFQRLGKRPKFWQKKVHFEGLFEKITYQITKANNIKTKLVSNNIKLKLISYKIKIKLNTRLKN